MDNPQWTEGVYRDTNGTLWYVSGRQDDPRYIRLNKTGGDHPPAPEFLNELMLKRRS